ncbi:hypothetical protein RRF57_002012 [Xylaria bambusicola]|uniref:Uncharacterized protein n=1 Tax=Xylaria bambusicola TaxID=326684 RepID=A0AAN7Z1E3_9PEZI
MSTTKSTSLDHRDELSKVISDLKSMYNRGVPWFTKEGIENVKRQMEKTAANIEEFPIIKFVGLNGKEVEVNFHRLANMYTHNSGGDLMLYVPYP